ncbi:Crp/Fnr family transcriptional regulator [Chitinophaga sp. HK235]|uniref:Crp/Fnr family transcriptional regulator n=1 Tax=Chitinophaga sp. HK235 TaxID=2952571 RepID=UPI001BAAAF13|nr:Crp/Fnr family transcriptional regulator [Chitinophaga sp. HK235]
MYSLLLQHINRYVQLNEEELHAFCNALELKKLRRHHFLLQEGDICKRDYFVIKGGLRQYETDKEGKERIIHFGFENWWITDRHSLITQTPSIYNIEALEPTEVLQINKTTLETLYDRIPRLERYFHLVLQESFALWQQRILQLQKPAEEKYRAFQAEYGAIEQRLPQQYIASYLGITRETLSRIRSQQ